MKIYALYGLLLSLGVVALVAVMAVASALVDRVTSC